MEYGTYSIKHGAWSMEHKACNKKQNTNSGCRFGIACPPLEEPGI
jgi:hypothetical protein